MGGSVNAFDTETCRAIADAEMNEDAFARELGRLMALQIDAELCGDSQGGYFWFGHNLIDDARERLGKRD
jgi:hypothetical protein